LQVIFAWHCGLARDFIWLGEARAMSAFGSVLGALVTSFVHLFHLNSLALFFIARACSATLGVLRLLKCIVPHTAASTPLPPCLLA
jgi:hypothetical protein